MFFIIVCHKNNKVMDMYLIDENSITGSQKPNRICTHAIQPDYSDNKLSNMGSRKETLEIR